jgi:hypothetical protein
VLPDPGLGLVPVMTCDRTGHPPVRAQHPVIHAARRAGVDRQGLAYHGPNGMLPSSAFCELFVAFNPIWATMIAAEYPSIEDVQQVLWERNR